MNKVHSETRFVQGLYPNLIESPAFPNDSELDPVQDKTVDLLLHEDGHLSRFFQQVLCRHHDLRVRPWGGDHLHQGSVEWRICLKNFKKHSNFRSEEKEINIYTNIREIDRSFNVGYIYFLQFFFNYQHITI